MLVGTNVDDWRLWLVVSGAIGQITDEILTGPVGAYGYQSLAAYGLDPATALAAYRDRYPTAGPGELLAKIQTDWWMRIPAIRLADALVAADGDTHRTYMYEFAWASPGLGAVHALEVPFVFDTASPDAPLFGPLLGPDPPQDLARTMHTAWVHFARHGNPGWLAVRPAHQVHDAVRHHLARRGQPPPLGAGPVARPPLMTRTPGTDPNRRGPSRRQRGEPMSPTHPGTQGPDAEAADRGRGLHPDSGPRGAPTRTRPAGRGQPPLPGARPARARRHRRPPRGSSTRTPGFLDRVSSSHPSLGRSPAPRGERPQGRQPGPLLRPSRYRRDGGTALAGAAPCWTSW